MRSIDWQDAENYRNRLLAELMEWCVDHGLSSEATEKQITIHLPTVDEINVWPEVKKRKVFDISTWGSKGIDETTDISPLPDDFQLPDTGEILEEGEPPKGDPNQEA